MSTRLFAAALLLLLLRIPTLHAQEPSEATLYMYECIKTIDAGEYEKAWEMLEVGAKRYPDDSSFPYEQAYIRYAQERYDDVQDILEDLIEKPDAEGGYYQLLGNAYDMDGDAEKAIRTYEKGLERFPESGQLHLELGVMAAKAEEYEKALGYWERGLTVEPDHSSNFFHAARMFLGSSMRGWGLLYGEIFNALEPTTKRAGMLREALWMGYNDAIKFADEMEETDEDDDKGSEETLGGISMFSSIGVTMDEEGKMLMPLEMYLEVTSQMASILLLLQGPPLTIAKLHDYRSSFIDRWYADGSAVAKHFDITLFEYQRRMKDAGVFEAYNHFLFMCEETNEEVRAYLEANPEAFTDLGAWLQDNPYPATVNPLSRLTVVGMDAGADDLNVDVKIKDEE